MKKKIIRKMIANLLYWKDLLLLIFRTKRYDSKIFCIGFNKTGTTTVGKSLKMLGYKHSSFNKKVYRKYYLSLITVK
jgi:hypothetical protein